MNPAGLLLLWDYNSYANALVFEVVAQLSAAEFNRASSPSHSTVHDLLFHLLEAEAYFVALCQGQPLAEYPALPTCAAMQAQSVAQTSAARAYIATLTEADLTREVTLMIKGRALRFTVAQAVVQICLHATHHRGELSIILTELGHPLPTMDVLLQFIQQSGQVWPP